MKPIRIFWMIVLNGCLILFWISTFIATHLPPQQIHDFARVHDKFAHCSAYGLLGFLLTGALATFRPWSWRLVLMAIAIAAAYGIFDELTQPFVGRSADVVDWIADVCGATIGSVLAGAVMQLLQSLQKSNDHVPNEKKDSGKGGHRPPYAQ